MQPSNRFISLAIKSISLFFLFSISIVGYSQPPCTIANYGSVPVLAATAYPYTSPTSGITVNATTAGGVATLSNFSYNCNGIAYNCTSPAWWLNTAAQSITLTFSVPVSAFSIIVNGTNTGEEFYFGVGLGQPPPCLQVVDFCTQNWATINGGTALIYNGTAAASNMITISNPPGATVYVLTHNGVGAGSRYAVVDCFLAAVPGGAITGTPAVVNATCGSCNGTATVTPVGGSAPYSYSWNTIPIQTTQTATGLCPGTYTVTITSGCISGTATATVTTTGPGTPPVMTPAGPSCNNGAPVTLTAAPAGGTWSGTGITNAALGTFNPAIAGTGTHVITYSVTVPCAATNTMNVVVNTAANATINPAAPVCASAPAFNLTAVDPGGTWTGLGITNAATGTFTPSVAGVGTHTITYTIAGACGDVQTTNVTVNPNFNATITPAGPFCTSTAAVNLTAVDPGGTWSGTGITNAATGTFDPNIAGIGTHIVTYTIAGACGDMQTTSITVNSQMDATITPAGPFCQANPNSILAAVDPGGIWSGTGIVNAANGTFSPSVAGAGTHLITYTIAGACGDVQTTSIQVIANANAAINAAGPFCETDLPLNLTSVQAGGTWTGNGITSAANGTFDPMLATPGTHVITYSIGGACGDVQTTNVIVNNLVLSTINPAGPFCVNSSSVTLTAATGGGIWSGIGITNAATGAFSPSVAGAGSHSITYTIGGFCGSASTTTILVNALSPVSFSPSVSTGCVPLAVVFTNNNPGSTLCQWSINGVPTGNTCANMPYSFNTAGCYDLTLQTTDVNGCTNSLTTPSIVCALPLPSAEFTTSENTVSVFNPTVSFSNLSLNANSYVWNFANLGSSNQANPPSFTFPSATGGIYEICLLATSAGGCADSICHSIEVKEEFLVYVPNAFTPNGDGVNEIFLPIVSGHNPDKFEFYVFTRWGEKIFESTNPTKGWDGTHKGIKSKTDVYVWRLIVKSASDTEGKTFTGQVSLMR